MSEEGLNIKLAEVIANIEERTDSELVAALKDTLTSVGTGLRVDSVNDQYKTIYSELDDRLEKQGQRNPNKFDDLWEFVDYWKENGLATYASRRSYVRSIYRNASASSPSDTWSNIHGVIQGVAKSRFDSGHYADAVEAAFKEINSRVKEVVRQRTGDTYDGAALMNYAFSVKKPVIILEDLETEDGRNIQNGYMQMFAGAMIAIRNPKAHSNVEIEREEAVPLIQLASLLFARFEAAVSRDANTEAKPARKDKRGVYVRIRDPNDTDKLLLLKQISHKYPGVDSIVLVLGSEKRSAIRLPFKVDASSSRLREELIDSFGSDSVVVKK